MISAHRTETREIAVTTLTAFLSATLSSEETKKIVAEFQTTLQTRSFYDGCLEPNAEFAYVMGLKQHDLMPQKFRLMGTAPHKMRSAARYFRRACELGKREAFRFLGDIYCDGIGAERCYRTAVEYYEQGTERGDPGSKFALGWCYRMGHFVNMSTERRFELYEAIEGGCGEAMEALGFLNCAASSHREAARLLGKAESMGVFAAKESYGLCYCLGLGVERDVDKAFKLFHESFHGGNPFAVAPLAHYYDNGLGVERNPAEATAVYERCIEAGSDASELFQPEYGLRLIPGIGLERDEARGKALIIDAMNSSLKWFTLGECFRYGIGFEQDKRRAKDFYRKTAEDCGYTEAVPAACVALAEMFETGDGVPSDINRATKYYLCAADHRQPKAQWKVALAFESGLGLAKNVHRAVFYFEMCANSLNSDATIYKVTELSDPVIL